MILPTGQVEMSEQVPGPVTFTWYVKIDTTKGELWESPFFWFVEPTSIEHQWKMIFCVQSSEGTSGLKHGRLTVKYCDQSNEGVNTEFIMKFCVHRTVNKVEFNQYIKCYDDTTVDQNAHHDFSQNDLHKVVIPQIVHDVFQLKVSCTIVKKFDNDVQNGFLLSMHEISLRREYLSLFETGNFSDVSFIIEKQKLKLHKNILSSRSVVFDAMFGNGFKENVCNEVYIEDHSFKAMKEFFRYVYAAETLDIEDNAIELLMLSNKYGVEGLKSLCEQSLIRSLENVNVLDYLNLAHLHNAKSLEIKCINFIASNATKIVKLSDFSINKVPEDLRDQLFKLMAQKP